MPSKTVLYNEVKDKRKVYQFIQNPTAYRVQYDTHKERFQILQQNGYGWKVIHDSSNFKYIIQKMDAIAPHQVWQLLDARSEPVPGLSQWQLGSSIAHIKDRGENYRIQADIIIIDDNTEDDDQEPDHADNS